MILRKIVNFSIAAGVLQLLASCTTGVTYTVGGNISGATSTVLITLNGGDAISMSGDGSFKFSAQLMTGDTYNVQVIDPSDRCTVANGAGTVDMKDIANVNINCGTQAAQTVVRSANLSGGQENPPVTTNASGVGGVLVNPTSLAITGGITVTGLTPLSSQIHIHQAPMGNPGGNGAAIIALTLAADGVTAIVPAGTVLTADQFTSLLAGELYFNVGTASIPNGQIRGAIQVQGGVAASVAALDQSQVLPPTASSATGTGTLIADLATGRILISYITHSVASPTAANIDTSTGPALVVSFILQTGLASPTAGTMLTAQNLADFAGNLLYFNVSSASFPNGEIRGNISPQ